MHKMLRDDGALLRTNGVPFEGPPASPPLLEVLWRRRWTFSITVCVCIIGAGLYLYLATPIFSATAKVFVEQNGPKVFTESQGFLTQSDNYLQTQADVFQSTAVLARALDAINYRRLNTFHDVSSDPVNWLRRQKGFKVTVAKKADIVLVSMESPFAEEAATIANGIVDAYMIEQTQEKRSTGNEMVRLLEKEKEQLLQARDAVLQKMLKFKLDNNVLSFGEDRGNTVLEKTASLSISLTSSEVATMELKAQQEAMKAAMASPAAMTAYIEAQQARSKEGSDKEYEELRTQRTQAWLALSSSSEMLGPDHPRVKALQSLSDSLKRRIEAKEKSMTQAQLASVSAQLVAAEEKERLLGAALSGQRHQALNLTPKATEYAKLEAALAPLQKQLDQINARIGEINVNSIEARPLNVKVVEAARMEDSPVKPNRTMAMAAAALIGSILGIGMVMFREMRDSRLRTPEQILTMLGMPVISTVPRVNMRLSPVTRGQVVRLDGQSLVAEAYRSVRASLHLGPASQAKTLLIASPMPGDGKSMTASNLAIAFAQAGERTLLIDCDLREPVQHLIFETDGAIGLTNVMAGEVKLRTAIRPTRAAGLHLLPAGPIPANPAELLSSKRFQRLLAALGKTFDKIIIDSPPLMRFTDARILAAGSDATVLVLRMNQSMRPLGALALDGLERVGARVLGAVANDVPSGKAYPYYGGSAQYAPRTSRLMDSQAAESVDAITTRLAEAREGQVTKEILAISEPDWSSDTQ